MRSSRRSGRAAWARYRARYASRSHRRDQGAAAGACRRSAAARALRARGARRLLAPASAHLRAVRRRPRGRPGLSGPRVSRGRDAGRPHRSRRRAATRRGAEDRRRGLRRARQGAPLGHRASRPQASQCDADEGGREAARRRARQESRAGRRVQRVLHAADDAPERHGPGDDGTFQDMAPEQIEGLEADARTDLFAFGLLFEMSRGGRRSKARRARACWARSGKTSRRASRRCSRWRRARSTGSWRHVWRKIRTTAIRARAICCMT